MVVLWRVLFEVVGGLRNSLKILVRLEDTSDKNIFSKILIDTEWNK